MQKTIKISLLLATTLSIAACANSQSTEVAPTSKSRHIGGSCEGCEAVYEYGDKQLGPVDTLPTFAEGKPKIKISGTVYHKDGKTPAGDVILYVYHTDREGIYPTKGDEKGWARRHGYIRGWMKTDETGKYAFYTVRPAPYPNSSAFEHIHVTVKEPDYNAYYIDEYLFADDPNLPASERDRSRNRGGSGILTLTKENGLWAGQRDIILGRNIPGYP